MKKEREYLDKHPAPRDMGDYVENITTVRSKEEIEHRNKMIEEIRGSDTTQEQMNFATTEINYNTNLMGKLFSNIFMSYLLEHRVKVPEIDFKVYSPTAVRYFRYTMKTEEGTDLSEEEIRINKATLREYTKQWLVQSKIKDYIEAWRLKNVTISTPRPSAPETGSVCIKPGVLITRRCALLSLVFYDKTILGHQNFMFWQIREEKGVVFIEYGICDNLKIHTHYQPMKGMNFNFHDVIREAFCEYLRDYYVDNIEIRFYFIENWLPFDTFDQLHYKELSYTCLSAARRAILYFAIFYDIFRLDYNDDMEHEIEHGALRDKQELTRKEILYVRNFMGYTHYMNKMIEWVLSSPLIWPVYDPSLPEARQARPTRERPLCIVLFPIGYQNQAPADVFLRNNGELDRFDVWTEFNDALYDDMSYIELYNFFERRRTRYYFHMDGGEVFRPERSEYDGSTCAVSAAADFPNLFGALSALHQRLKVLEMDLA